jgi:2-amino-4-hydroxy-6-hydroxymethyldihydropteridine diphosphokinase
MELSSFKKHVFVGLGSNLDSAFGSPKDNVLEAVERIKLFSDEPILVSCLLESEPLDCPPGSPDFINAVVAFSPKQNETPLSLLHRLQNIENAMGRNRSGLKNEARLIDLDLLIFKEQGLQSEELKLPHPEILNRDFVLQPLQEILSKKGYEGLIAFIKKLRQKRS